MTEARSTKRGPAKRPRLHAALLRLAQRLGPDAPMPKVRELAARYKVSLCTLDRVLDQLERQGHITRLQGSGIRTTKYVGRQTFAIVFGKSISYAGASPFWGLLHGALRRQLRARRARTESYFDFDSAWEHLGHCDLVLNQLEQRPPTGILLTNVRSAEDAAALVELGVPVVVFGTTDGRCPGVSLDGLAVIRDGVAELAARGCRRIGLITTRDAQAVTLFRAELESRGLAYDPAWVWEQHIFEPADPDQPFETHEEAGYRAMKQWLVASGQQVGVSGQQSAVSDQPAGVASQFPDGVLITDDMLTRGALVALRRAGVTPGRDVQVATHANKGSAALLGHETELIRLEVDPEEIARAMIGLLDKALAGQASPTDVVTIKPQLRA